MGNELEIQMVVTTTHVDRHGEQFTKEDLEHMAEDTRSSDRPRWLYWNHETTLPPIGHFGVERVELREDGEYQLVSEGILFGEDWSEPMNSNNVSGINITFQEIDDILEPITLSKDGYLVITYDTINYKRDLIRPIVESLNELVPTEEQIFRRKAEIPHEVIWVLVGFAGGIISRFGEKAADVITDTALQFYKELNSRFTKILELKPGVKPDVIFNVPIPNTNTIVEAAVEEVSKNDLEIAWRTLPVAYAIASRIINRCPPDHFADIKFLFNLRDNRWEINYCTVRSTHKIILGPRYYQPDHPQYQRWKKALKQINTE